MRCFNVFRKDQRCIDNRWSGKYTNRSFFAALNSFYQAFETFDTDAFLARLQSLMDAAYSGDEDGIRALVAELVPTYRPAGRNGSEEKTDTYQQQLADALQKELTTV